MKITVNTASLLHTLTPLTKVTVKNASLPILENILFIAENNKVCISASNLENTITVIANGAEADIDGKMAINATDFIALLKTLPGEGTLIIALSEDKTTIKVSWETGENTYPAANPDEFPVMENSEGAFLDVRSGDLKTALIATMPSLANNELRPIINGICLDLSDNKLNVVATDARQLFLATISVKNICGDKNTIVIPASAANALKVMLDDCDTDATICLSEKNAAIRCAGNELRCRLIEGKYPAYASVMPKDCIVEITCNRETLISAIKRTSLCDETTTVLSVKDNELSVSSENLTTNRHSVDKISCKSNGELTIKVKGEMLTSVLSRMPGEDIILRLTKESSPILVIPTQKEMDLQAIVMPLMK